MSSPIDARDAVVLDIDKTLVAVEHLACPIDDADRASADFVLEYREAENYLYRRRPFLTWFCDAVFATYRVFVYSDNSREHIDRLLPLVFGRHAASIAGVFDESHCSVVLDGCWGERGRVKLLKDVERAVGRRCVLVDDKEINVERNPGRAVLVTPFEYRDDEEAPWCDDDALLGVLEGIAVLLEANTRSVLYLRAKPISTTSTHARSAFGWRRRCSVAGQRRSAMRSNPTSTLTVTPGPMSRASRCQSSLLAPTRYDSGSTCGPPAPLPFGPHLRRSCSVRYSDAGGAALFSCITCIVKR